MLGLATPALRNVAGKQDCDGVKVWAGKAAHPVVRMVLSSVAKHLGSGDHALLKLLENGMSEASSSPARAGRSR